MTSRLQQAPVSCNAAYATPCARTNAEFLVRSVIERAQSANLLQDPIGLEVLFRQIRGGEHNLDTAFYPFVFHRETAVNVASGFRPELFLNKTLSQLYFEARIFANASSVHQCLTEAADMGGDWCQLLLPEWSGEFDQDVANSTAKNHLAYSASLTDDFYIGVAYQDSLLPLDIPCSAEFDSWCSITNVRRLVGTAQLALNLAESQASFDREINKITQDTATYTIEETFYPFIYQYDGGLRGHPNFKDSIGLGLDEIYERHGLGTREEGQALHYAFMEAADMQRQGTGSGWIQYQWKDSIDEESYTKVAYITKIEFGGVAYYLGSGYRLSTEGVFTAALGTECTEKLNEPCAYRTALQLSSHAFSHLVSRSAGTPVSEAFRAISSDDFRRGDAYVFVFDYDGTCVSHGQVPEYVGMTLGDIFEARGVDLNATAVLEQFRRAASAGGGLVIYPWGTTRSAKSVLEKVSMIFQLNVNGRHFFGGVGFFDKRAPVQHFAATGLKHKNQERIPCSRMFSRKCSEVNVLVILGQSLTDLALATSPVAVLNGNQTLASITEAINRGDAQYRVEDFYVSVFSVGEDERCEQQDESGCCIADGSNSSLAGQTWQQILSSRGVTAVQGTLLHDSLVEASSESEGFDLEFEAGNGQTLSAQVAGFSENGKRYYVMSTFVKDPPPPTCDACPTGMVCTEEGQSYCVASSAGESSVIIAPLVVVLCLLLGVLLKYWWNVRRFRKILKYGEDLGRPKEWTPSKETLVKLKESEEEYWDIFDRLRKTMPTAHITNVWRVQNMAQWSHFRFHVNKISRQKGFEPSHDNEKLVWHGTSERDPDVIYDDEQHGFMINYARDGFWGRGLYFAENSVYSKSYSFEASARTKHGGARGPGQADEREMFLARLMVGSAKHMNRDVDDATKAECESLTVPPINLRTGLRYNTVTGNSGGSKIYIVYENGRAYPEYLVRFYEGARDPSRTPYESKAEAVHMLRQSSSTFPSTRTPSEVLSSVSSNEDDSSWEFCWEFESDTPECWVPYDANHQGIIESAFQREESSVTITTSQWQYKVHLREMKQTNVHHPDRKKRDVRRLSIDNAV